MPLSAPVFEFSANHDGKAPAVTAKVYVPEPLVALKVALYAVFAVAFVSVAGLTVKLLAGFTVSVYALLPRRDELLRSVAVIVKLDEPVVVGVPLNTPVFTFSANHDGSTPAVTA